MLQQQQFNDDARGEDAALEAQARRAAKRVGLLARKCRRGKGTSDNKGRFAVIDPNSNLIVAGVRFELSPTEVIEYVLRRD